jgi:hypothetical protein
MAENPSFESLSAAPREAQDVPASIAELSQDFARQYEGAQADLAQLEGGNPAPEIAAELHKNVLALRGQHCPEAADLVSFLKVLEDDMAGEGYPKTAFVNVTDGGPKLAFVNVTDGGPKGQAATEPDQKFAFVNVTDGGPKTAFVNVTDGGPKAMAA